MPQIEKGGPQKGTGPPQTELGIVIRKLAETAFVDKGVWYSAEQPPDVTTSSIHSTINAAVKRLTAQTSSKGNRIWLRFYKDSDASE